MPNFANQISNLLLSKNDAMECFFEEKILILICPLIYFYQIIWMYFSNFFFPKMPDWNYLLQTGRNKFVIKKCGTLGTSWFNIWIFHLQFFYIFSPEMWDWRVTLEGEKNIIYNKYEKNGKGSATICEFRIFNIKTKFSGCSFQTLSFGTWEIVKM